MRASRSTFPLATLLLLASAALAAEPLLVSGQVLDPEGEPLAGAGVELLPETDPFTDGLLILGKNPRPEVAARAVSDEEGFYGLRVPTPGVFRLRISKPGHRTVEERILVVQEAEAQEPRTLPRSRTVQVRVIDPGGRPIAGARVVAAEAGASRGRFRLQAGQTDEAGESALEGAEGQVLRLTALGEGFAPSEAVESEAGSVVLRLQAGSPREVEVRDRRGEPVAGALVRVGDLGLPVGLTEEGGRITLQLPAGGRLPITAEVADGRRAEGLTEVPEKAAAGKGAPTPVLVLRLLDPLSLGGRVIDTETRAPLVGAWVLGAALPGVAATSGRDGVYTLEIPPGRGEILEVTAAAAGYLPEQTRVEREALSQGRIPTLALEPAAAVSGLVVDRAGKPVPGARVSVSSRHWGPLRETRSDPNGRFLVTGLRPGEPHLVEAGKEGFAPAQEELPTLEPRNTFEGLRLVLLEGRTAFGRVADRDDRPVPGAEVSLTPAPTGGEGPWWWFQRRRHTERKALTDRDGRFAATDLPTGTLDLEVQAEGFAPARVPGVEISADGQAQDLGTIVLEVGTVLEGRVVDPEAVPVEGAQVRAISQALFSRSFGPSETPEASTSVDGRFRLRGFRAGDRLRLEVSREGYARRDNLSIEVPLAEPLEIVLEPAARVSGTVVDRAGKPISNAQILAGHAVSNDGRTYISTVGTPASSDEDGEFLLLDLPADELSLQAVAEGYQRSALVHVELTAGRELSGARLILDRAAALHGQVVDSGGKPVAGAIVYTLETGWATFQGRGARTDGDGRYRLDGLAPGSYTFAAQHEGHPQVVRDLQVQAGDNRLDFAFPAGFEVSGTVFDSGGAPLPGASVTLQAVSAGMSQRTTSGLDGSFAWKGVPPGSYRLAAQRNGFAAAELPEILTIDAGDVSGLEIRLGPGGSIRGRILGLTLDELTECQVYAFHSSTSSAFARPDFEGEFLLENLAAGEWAVFARGSGGRSVSEKVTLAPGVAEVPVELEFTSGFTLEGRVVAGAEPVDGAWVSASGLDSGSSPGYASTSPDGSFRITDLSAGSYRLRVSGGAGGAHHEETLELDSDREVLIDLGTGRISGRVVDASDSGPLAGVGVHLEPAQARPLSSPGFDASAGSGVSDAQGSFRIRNVAAGSYRLVFLKEGYGRAELPVVVEPGLDAEGLEMRLSPTPGLELRLAAPTAGAVPPHVLVIVQDPASGAAVLTSTLAVGEQGTVRVPSVPAGRWILVLGGSGLTSSPTSATVPGPPVSVALVPEAKLEISLPALAGTDVRVQTEVLDDTGRPFGVLSIPRVVREGATSVGSLPPGNWTVRITAPDGRVWSGTASTTAGATSRLVLE